MKKNYAFILLFAAIFSFGKINAQSFFCDTTSNVIIYSNYDGGSLVINIDQNIPNLKIGICSYEATQVSITGTYVGNVTKVWYAGYNGTNDHCNLGITNSTITGVPNNVDTIQIYPAVTYSDPNGSPNMVCAYQCVSGNQGGCNTPEQVADFFMTKFGATSIRFHRTGYNCWPSQAVNISQGGNCCLVPISMSITEEPTTPNLSAYPNPADEFVSINYTSELSGLSQIMITDIAGREINRQSVNTISGKNSTEIKTGEIPAGWYLVRLMLPDGTSSCTRVQLQ
jgi:Secretion system C-terminal sorting domain